MRAAAKPRGYLRCIEALSVMAQDLGRLADRQGELERKVSGFSTDVTAKLASHYARQLEIERSAAVAWRARAEQLEATARKKQRTPSRREVVATPFAVVVTGRTRNQFEVERQRPESRLAAGIGKRRSQGRR